MWLALPNAMASNGVPGNDGVALKKRKAVGTSARGKVDEHEDQELPLQLSAVKKSKRTTAARRESEFVSVEVGLRELQKRMASTSTTPEKAQKKKTPKQQVEAPAVKEVTKKASAGRAKIAIAAVEDADEELKTTAATPKRRTKAATATPKTSATMPVVQEPEAPVKATRRSATPTKRTATAADEGVPKRAVKPKTTPAKSVLDTLAQARAAAMQQQQERIQQRIQGLTGAAVPPVAEPAPRRSPVLKSKQTPRPKDPQTKGLETLSPQLAVQQHQQVLSATEPQQVNHEAPSSPPRIRKQEEIPTPPLSIVAAEPTQSSPAEATSFLPTAELQLTSHEEAPAHETQSSQGLVDDDDFDEDLAFLQALEEVESKLQTPTKPPRPTLSPSAQPVTLATSAPQPVDRGVVPASPPAAPLTTPALSAECTRAVDQVDGPEAPKPCDEVSLTSIVPPPRSPPVLVSAQSSPPATVPAPTVALVTGSQAETSPTAAPAQPPARVTAASAAVPARSTVSPPPVPILAPVTSPFASLTPAIPPEILAEYERLKQENEALRRSNELLQAGKSTIAVPESPVVASSITALGDTLRAGPLAPPLATPIAAPVAVPIATPVAASLAKPTVVDVIDVGSSMLPVNNETVSPPLKPESSSATIDDVPVENTKPNEVTTTASEVQLTSDVSTFGTSSVALDNRIEQDDDGDVEVVDESVDVGGDFDIEADADADSEFAHKEEDGETEEDEEEPDLSQPVETHQSTIDRGNYDQYRSKAGSNADDDDLDDDTAVYARRPSATGKPVRSGLAASHLPQKRQDLPRDSNSTSATQARNRVVHPPAKQMPRPVVADDSETESDEEQHRRRRVAALPDSSSSSSEESDDEEDQAGKSGSSVLDAALRAATGKAPLKSAPKTTAKATDSTSGAEKRARALEKVKEGDNGSTPTSSITELSTKRVTKKRRATTLSAKDKSTLLWPSLDDFYDFVLDLTPRRVLLSDPLHLQLLRAYEKARARLPMQYPGLVQYCDVQSEAILEELLSSVRNAEEMSLYNSSRSRLWLTSISPCSNTSSHTSTVMNAALASSSTSSSLNPNVIFMESGFSGTSAAGKNDYIVTFQDNRAGANQKSALSDFVSGDLLAMRSPAWRDLDIYAFGIVLCSSVVAVGGSASSGNGGGSSSANQDQLCVLIRAPSATEDDPDAASRFASIVEMCLVNQRSTQWCWSLDQVHNLTTSAREFQAIKSVRLFKPETKEMIISGIIPEIVKTEQTQIIEPRKKLSSGLYEELEGKYNASQLQAILGSISDESAISIIQGPPGTGKTKTILGVLSALLDGAALSSTRQAHVKSRIRIGASLQENSSKASSKSTGNDQKSVAQSTIRVLVAAPSNAAVDELIVRLISEGVYDARQGKSYRPRIVRVGRPESLQQSRPDRSEDPKSQDILKKKKWRKYASEVEEILLENLVNKHKSSFPTAKQARQSIIQNAQIVFCTLSGAGSVAMCELQAQHFDALVIDEAAQAVEASLLIPFKFQPSRIVLVGDHRQLPATVISKRLIDLGYDRSLFQRLVENGSRVFMLLQQYRMHPEISWFPSTYFYNGKLVEAPQMKEWTARKYHRETFFRPFVFYDVLSGKQSQVNGSKSLRNVNEIECILVLLTRLVVEQFPELEWRRKIGIIAPYKQQIYELRNELQRWEKKHDKKLDIEVNTVDGFQGREKEVIIYSCVRTSRTGQSRSSRQSNGQSIEAFWADERRMNVAITRAKSSLWIIGNSTLLQQSAAWRALITHAKDSRRYMLEEDLSGKKRRDSDADRSQSQARSADRRDRSQSQAKSSDRSRSQARSRDRSQSQARRGDRSIDKERARSRSRSRSRHRDRDRRR